MKRIISVVLIICCFSSTILHSGTMLAPVSIREIGMHGKHTPANRFLAVKPDHLYRKVSHPFFPETELILIKAPRSKQEDFYLNLKDWGRYQMFYRQTKHRNMVYITSNLRNITNDTPKEYFEIFTDHKGRICIKYIFGEISIDLNIGVPHTTQKYIGDIAAERLLGLLKEALSYRETLYRRNALTYYWFNGFNTYSHLEVLGDRHSVIADNSKNFGQSIDTYAVDNLGRLALLGEVGLHPSGELSNKFSNSYFFLTCNPYNKNASDIFKPLKEVVFNLNFSGISGKKLDDFTNKSRVFLDQFAEKLEKLLKTRMNGRLELSDILPEKIIIEDLHYKARAVFHINKNEFTISRLVKTEKIKTMVSVPINKIMMETENIVKNSFKVTPVSALPAWKLYRYGYSIALGEGGVFYIAPITENPKPLPKHIYHDMPLNENILQFKLSDIAKSDILYRLKHKHFGFHPVSEERAADLINNFCSYLLKQGHSFIDIRHSLSVKNAISSTNENVEWVKFANHSNTADNYEFYIIIYRGNIIGHGRYRLKASSEGTVDFTFYLAQNIQRGNNSGHKLLGHTISNIFFEKGGNIKYLNMRPLITYCPLRYQNRIINIAQKIGINLKPEYSLSEINELFQTRELEMYKNLIMRGTPAFFINNGFNIYPYPYQDIHASAIYGVSHATSRSNRIIANIILSKQKMFFEVPASLHIKNNRKVDSSL